jgi:hypothetical protein
MPPIDAQGFTAVLAAPTHNRAALRALELALVERSVPIAGQLTSQSVA